MSKSAKDVMAEVNKVMGEGTVMLGSDPSLTVTYLPTGILPLDDLLQGGIPRGRSVEIYGDFSTLKSYVGLSTIAQAQADDQRCALIDTEHAYDPMWAGSIGVSTGDLLLMQPATGEEAVNVTEVLIRDGYDLIVWDSVAATMPKQHQEKRAGEDTQPGALARFMSQGLRRLTAANKQTALLFVNQTRINVGMTYGASKDSVPGGKALPFYASYRIRMAKAGRKTKDIKVHDGEKMVGAKETTAFKIKASLEKSKLNKPFRECWFVFDLTAGEIDVPGWIISQGLERGIITLKGAWYKVPDYTEESAQGFDGIKGWLDDQEFYDWMVERITEEHEGNDEFYGEDDDDE